MIGGAFIAMVAAAALPQSGQASASMGVGAIVVRELPAARPAVAIERGSVIISNARDVTVSAQGAVLRRTRAGTFEATPGSGRAITITLTY